MENNTIGEIIKNRRNELGITLEYIGKQVGVNKSTISRWERGKTDSMNKAVLVMLAKVLYLDPRFLLGSKNAEAPEPPEIVKLKRELVTRIENIRNMNDLIQIDKFINAFIK